MRLVFFFWLVAIGVCKSVPFRPASSRANSVSLYRRVYCVRCVDTLGVLAHDKHADRRKCTHTCQFVVLSTVHSADIAQVVAEIDVATFVRAVQTDIEFEVDPEQLKLVNGPRRYIHISRVPWYEKTTIKRREV